MQQLHPGARWVFRFRAYSSFIFLVIFLFFFSLSTLTRVLTMNSGSAILGVVLIVLLVAIILTILIGEVYARMAYNRWFYEFTKDSLKLERGIIWKKYSNIPYERVQNVDIRRGILARIIGYSTIDIQTAGFHMTYGRGGTPRSEGHIPAVAPEKAEQIREFLMKKISKHGQGL